MTEHIGNRLIELTDDECQALLESSRIGRAPFAAWPIIAIMKRRPQPSSQKVATWPSLAGV